MALTKDNTKPNFVQQNRPTRGMYHADRSKNPFLRFYDKTVGHKDNVKTLAKSNQEKALAKHPDADVITAEQNVLLCVGNFLAETAHGVAEHGQNISSNAEASAALDKLVESYESYHNLLQESGNSSEVGDKARATVEPVASNTGDSTATIEAPQNTTVKSISSFQPKTPVKTAEASAQSNPESGTNTQDSGNSGSEARSLQNPPNFAPPELNQAS